MRIEPFESALVALITGLAILLGSAWWAAHANWQNVAAEWDQYRLNDTQLQWFKSIHAPSGIPCCDIADGHPTEMERRIDGIYIPDPVHLEEPRQWIKVPDEAIIKGATNPVGVATVWYALQSSDTVYIRCFVPTSDT